MDSTTQAQQRWVEPQHSPVGPEVRQGPVQRQAIAQVGVVAVILELFEGDTSVFRTEILAPVSKER